MIIKRGNVVSHAGAIEWGVGKVVEVNDPLSDAPETINEDPYEEGWMIVIEPSDRKELEALLDAKAYRAFVEEQE